MSWKDNYQISDLSPDQMIGFVCKACQLSQPKTVAELITLTDKQLYMYEVEQALVCRTWNCKGKLRMELSHDIIVEGFQGGLT